MKSSITFLLLLISFISNAQVELLDTIYANEHKNVALFFPKPIRQGITGASHFVFTYNREQKQYFGLLQAKPGMNSNLLAITSDGTIYSYILKYDKDLQQLNYFLKPSQSIGREKPVELKNEVKKKPKDVYKNRVTFFEKYSRYLLNKEPRKLASKRVQGVKLQLQQMEYQGNEVYLVFEIENTSGIDFEIDYLNISMVNANKKRRASHQHIPLNIVYNYEFPEMIKDTDKQQFVFVVPKFVLGKHDRLLVELQERKGHRKVVAQVKN